MSKNMQVEISPAFFPLLSLILSIEYPVPVPKKIAINMADSPSEGQVGSSIPDVKMTQNKYISREASPDLDIAGIMKGKRSIARMIKDTDRVKQST